MVNFDKAEAEAFWKWFSTVAGSLARSNFVNNEILAEIDRRLFSIDSRLNWEIGPHQDSSNCQFVISPNFNNELLPICRALLDLAPKIEGWILMLFKPRRAWNNELTIRDVGGEAIHLDTSLWRYVMLRYPDDEMEILIAANTKLPFDDGSRLRWLAGALTLEALLGEKTVMECVQSWDVYDFLEPRFDSAAKEIRLLPEAFGFVGGPSLK